MDYCGTNWGKNASYKYSYTHPSSGDHRVHGRPGLAALDGAKVDKRADSHGNDRSLAGEPNLPFGRKQ